MELGVAACAYKLSIWEMDEGGLGIQGPPWLYSKFEVSLCVVRLSLLR